jgi:prepilin-type N-terminal cleavage/methylation domain-containing protein
MGSARGYTIVEFLVVMSVMAVLMAVGFQAMGKGNDSERLRNGQRQLVDDLRSIQNQAFSGNLASWTGSTHIATFSSAIASYYLIDGRTVNLPTGVFVRIETPSPTLVPLADSLTVYFYHPAKVDFSPFCLRFSCWTRSLTTPLLNRGEQVSSNSIVLLFTISTSSLQKRVTIEGGGTAVTRIYEH